MGMGHGFVGVSPAEYAKAADLTKAVLELSRNTLLIRLRFLDAAINRLKTAIHAEIAFASDGNCLYYEPFSLLRRYRQEPDAMNRDLLHVLIHSLLCHPWFHSDRDRAVWDLACDIAVEIIAAELGFPAKREEAQREILQQLRRDVRPLTAEKIYRYYLKQNLSSGQIREIRKHFRVDDHGLWYQEDGFQPAGNGDDWAQIARRAQTDLQTFSRGRREGSDAGALLQNLTAVNRERYDYEAFLRKFATRQEEMKIDDEEFDYIFYTYGLKLYDKMPLVEPLEYKEIKKVQEFVIAIDTSGSVSGDLVQAFVQKTYNLLKTTESFASKVHIRILQCDKTIQEDVKITTAAEFDDYLKHMTLKGFGGTDFRPVFDHVEKLRKRREFTNLRGLIYFTDGLGTFPAQKPDYETAFIFLREDDAPTVPTWAIKLVLEPEELESIKTQ